PGAVGDEPGRGDGRRGGGARGGSGGSRHIVRRAVVGRRGHRGRRRGESQRPRRWPRLDRNVDVVDRRGERGALGRRGWTRGGSREGELTSGQERAGEDDKRAEEQPGDERRSPLGAGTRRTANGKPPVWRKARRIVT